MTTPITRADIEELRRHERAAKDKGAYGLVMTAATFSALLDAADERDRLRALLSRAGAMLLAFESSEASVLDSEELRERIEAELRPGHSAPDRDPDE